MISDIIKAIVSELKALYPSCHPYKNYDPQNFTTPAFLITIADQDYSKRLNTAYKSKITIDVQYFSGVKSIDISGVRADCIVVQESLFRGFDLIGPFRVMNKDARITDDVLHFTFDISYSEICMTEDVAMGTLQTNTNTKE